MRHGVFIGLVIIAYLVLIFSYVNSGKEQGRVCFEASCFDVTLALTSYEQSRGLMFVEQLDGDRGMLFVFEKNGIHPFWMKNTLIPLDIIWIDSDNSIVFISRNTKPCETTCNYIYPGKEARYVLEINAGLSDKIGLAVGDKVTIE